MLGLIRLLINKYVQKLSSIRATKKLASTSNLLPAPTLQIHDDRESAAARDDPDDVVVGGVDCLVFGPGGDEGEVAGVEILGLWFLAICELVVVVGGWW